MSVPLAIDLFCGLGGWTSGLLAEGWQVIGFDIERHVYGEHKYPAQLVLQDVLTLHGSQFKNVNLIVASPPCQEYSYMAMPWKKAKAKAAAIRADTTGAEVERLNRLFNACFRIQREACEAAGRHIPMVVENVRGAVPWVGRSRWNFGSFHLWGDIPALMPPINKRAVLKNGVTHRADGATNFHGHKVPGFRFDGSGGSFQPEAVKVGGLSWNNYGKPGYKAQGFNVIAAQRVRAAEGIKLPSTTGRRTAPGSGARFTSMDCGTEGQKVGKDWFGGYGGGFGWDCSPMRRNSSKSNSRKFASAMIAKIPEPLSRHIARVFKP